MSDFDISYNLNYGSMARGEQHVKLCVRPSLVYTEFGPKIIKIFNLNHVIF